MWIVATPLWMLGSCWWVIDESRDFAEQLTMSNCNALAMSSEQFGECYKRQIGPEPDTTWFMSNMASYGWFLLLVPPVVVFVLGWITLKLGLWIARGFQEAGDSS